MPNGQLKISTISNVELVNITSEIDKILQSQPISSGVIHLFNPHTTAGLIINEGADPDVCLDILQGLAHMVPRNLGYKHREGNSPSHIMTMLTGSNLTLFIENGKLQLGTWQKIFFCEFDGPGPAQFAGKLLPIHSNPFPTPKPLEILMNIEPDKMCFGLTEDLDRQSFATFLQLSGRKEFAELFAERLSSEEIIQFVDAFFELLKKHLSKNEYHQLFLLDLITTIRSNAWPSKNCTTYEAI